MKANGRYLRVHFREVGFDGPNSSLGKTIAGRMIWRGEDVLDALLNHFIRKILRSELGSIIADKGRREAGSLTKPTIQES